MPVAIVGPPTDSGGFAGVASKTFAKTCTGGANNLLLVGVEYYDGTSIATATVTWAGVAMASLGKKTGTTATTTQVEFFGLINPAGGSNNIVITFSGAGSGQYGGAGAQEYSGVDSATPTNNFISAEGQNTDATFALTVTSAIGDYATVAMLNSYNAPSWAGDQAAINRNFVGAVGQGNGSDAAGAASVTFNATWGVTGTGGWCAAGLNVKAFIGAAIVRPLADLVSTGWTASTGLNLAAMINETVRDDANYISSPQLDGSQGPYSSSLTQTLAAGSYSVRLAARWETMPRQMRVLLLDNADAVQGASAWTPVANAFAVYTLSITTSGPATRQRIEAQ